jgi:hypothetical protein
VHAPGRRDEFGQHLVDRSRGNQVATRIGDPKPGELGIVVVEELSPRAGQNAERGQLAGQLLAFPSLLREFFLDLLTAVQELVGADHGFPHRSHLRHSM